ncbi:uncharacterized protein LOC108941522 isoform X2 [Scleropages formosus]|uniref:uncharacterized protein LOC108941522 isoform X2 n=1 Tax=Scleropages formosus TaxID=113540 RepID=UPI00087871A3|nr:spermatogenesis- and oogenesis-specific basic helix-loop-helix-containing protein 2 isoform X2 [Scleropages formosus]
MAKELRVKVIREDQSCKPVLKGGSTAPADSNLQALLHSQKEQKRRLQIKKCCNSLRDLLPFVTGRLDTATILELTVSYVTYLQQRMPSDILEKVVKALQDTRTRSWFKSTKAPRKRKMNMLKEKPTVKPATTEEDFANEFIAANVLGRHIQPRKESTLLPTVPACPLQVGQPFPTPLDLNTSPAKTVILQQNPPPFGQSVASRQMCTPPFATVMNRKFASSMFPYQTPFCPVGEASHTITPEMSLNVNISQAGIINYCGPIPRQPVMVNQTDFQQMAFDQVHPLSSPVFMNEDIAPLAVLNQNFAETVALREMVTQLPCLEGVVDSSSFKLTKTWPDLVVPQLLYESSDSSLPSFTSFLETGTVSPLLQIHDSEPMCSMAWTTPNQWAISEVSHVSQTAFHSSLPSDLPYSIQEQTGQVSCVGMSEICNKRL